jgi:predicted DNA-binding antitoxin AbrB/MazE fold protein
LKLTQPLSLPEGIRVRVTISPAEEEHDPLEGVIGICKSGPVDGAQNHDKHLYGDLRR